MPILRNIGTRIVNLELLDVLKTKYGVTGLRHLGNGGFGIVYSGNVYEVPRAIKVSRDVLDERWLAMTEQELGFMQQPAIVDCPTIVQLILVRRELGHLITVWELGEQSLAKRLAECQRQGLSGLPPEELERYLRDAASALDVINGIGIRHRDIKPDNILVVRGRAKIADLGLAVFVGASSLSKTASGTMGYIAPEAYGDEAQGHGRLTATVDIYALAATAIKLATGRDPFGTNPREIIKNQEAGQPDTTGLTEQQIAAALSALHPDPQQRPFTTAAEFVEAFVGNVIQRRAATIGASSSFSPNAIGVGASGRSDARAHADGVAAKQADLPDPAKTFDFDLVATLESTEAEVRSSVAEARRLEAVYRYGEAAELLELVEPHLRDNGWLRTLRDKQARVDVLTAQIAEAVRTKQHRWIRPLVEELLGLLPHDQKLKELRDKLPEFAPELTHPSGIKLKLILPGEFLMGSTPSQIKRLVRDIKGFEAKYANNEQPQHRVRITQPFYCGVTPVTQADWKAVMGKRNNPSKFLGDDQLPVENVSWDMITQEFLPKANALPKANTIGDLRLPTEAEWEYCCRAGTTTIFPWGDDVGRMDYYAWYDGNSDKKTHPVGQKQPNDWGLYDFTGQVWEWCQDVYDAEMYGRRSGITVDPVQTTGSDNCVLRGGSWVSSSRYTSSAYRNGGTPVGRGSDYSGGFRLMMPVSPVRTS